MGRNKHILHLNKTPVGATWMCRQVRELVRLGWNVSVAMPVGGGVMAEQFRHVGATVYDKNFDIANTPRRLPNLLSGFRKFVDEIKPDLIHSHFVGTTLTMRLALAGRDSVPRLFQVPGPLHLEHVFFRWLDLQTSNQHDYWMGSCTATNEVYRSSGIENERLFLSYYGVDLDTYQQFVKGKLRSMLGLSEEAQLAGMVAYMYPPKIYLGQKRGLKGHEDFIDALSICMRTNPDLYGVCIGGAWKGADAYEQSVRNYARKKCGDRLFFLGNRTDVPELYADLDIAVHPSLSENVGGAVESLLFAVPTIASSVGGFPDLVRPGETGRLVPPRAPALLADQIAAMLKNLPEERDVARRGQQLVQQMFDVRSTAQAVSNAYASILNCTTEEIDADGYC